MGWVPLFKYTFENHVAVDETGNGNFGMVQLPNPDRWVDVPAKGIATAVRYDDPRSKIVIADRPSFAGWAGFRVNVIFQPSTYDRRINLVEGDSSFAFFVEVDGSLQGTINDGKHWYGVSTPPGTIIAGNWYIGEFLYDPSTMMILRLNGVVMSIVVTHGDPVRPVGPAGIMIGYWPGGDDRYTYLGLIGPVGIETLDPENSLLTILGKLVCGGNGRLEALLPVVENEFTPSEQQQAEAYGTAVVDAAKHLMASVMSTSSDQMATMAQLQALSHQVTDLLIEDEKAGVDLFQDPAFPGIIAQAYQLLSSTSANVENVLLAEVLKLLAMQPLTPARVQEILTRHPELCTDGPGTNGQPPFGPGNPLGGIIGKICQICCQYGCSSGGTGGGGAGGGGTGGGTGGGGTAGGGTGGGGTGGGGTGSGKGCCEVHVHVHCNHV